MPHISGRATPIRLLLLLIFVIGTGVLLRDHSGPPGEYPSLQDEFGPMPIPYRGKNRLNKAKSPYLKGAADETVWWLEWGPEPFLLARTLNRPILLDIGATWCHWCRLMDMETYRNPAVADIINANFIAVKVDRDERPDLDGRYQVAVRAISDKGGWPLTAFLTPDGDVYYGGSAFFVPTVGGQPGFLDLLPRLAEAFKREAQAIQMAASFLRGQLVQYLALDAPDSRLDPTHIKRVAEAISADFDREEGGFGNTGPKFAEPEAWLFVLQWAFYDGWQKWRPIIDTTLQRMAGGGIFDQLAGGFHRYTADREWNIPHFEKLLGANAAMLRLYTTAYAATRAPLYKDVAEQTASYILRYLRDRKTGLFFNHQDADDPGGEEGAYYAWTKADVDEALTPEERQVVVLAFDIQDVARDLPEHRQWNILRRGASVSDIARRLGWDTARVEDLLAIARAKLLVKRATRLAPEVSTASYVNTSSMAAGALLRGSIVLDRPDWETTALSSLERIWVDGFDEKGGLARGFVDGEVLPRGLFADYVWFMSALLDAYEATGKKIYLERAAAIATFAELHFADEAGGGFLDRPRLRNGATFVGLEETPLKAFFDHGEAAENPLFAIACDRLAYLSENPDWRVTADGILLSLAGMHPDGIGRTLSTYGSALLYHLKPPAVVLVTGEPGDVLTSALARVARQSARPWTFVRVNNDRPPSLLGGREVETTASGGRKHRMRADNRAEGTSELAGEGEGKDTGRAVALVCVAGDCARPTSDPAELGRQLDTFQRAFDLGGR